MPNDSKICSAMTCARTITNFIEIHTKNLVKIVLDGPLSGKTDAAT